MSTVRFSIVTCSRNQVDFVEDCVRSILSQDYPDLEYVVIDGASTDDSVEIISRYSDQLAFWASEPDRGQAHALNKGFSYTTGDIMGYLCSDDILESGALVAVTGFFEDHPDVDVVFGDAILIDPRGRPIGLRREVDFDMAILLADWNYIPQPATFWRRRIWERVGGLDESYHYAMDYDLWMRFHQAGARIEHIPSVLARMRIYSSQKSKHPARVARELERVRRRCLGRRLRWPEKVVYKAWNKARRLRKRWRAGIYTPGFVVRRLWELL